MKKVNLSFKRFQALRIEFDSFVRIQKLFSIIVLAGVLAGAFPVAAQTQRPVNTGSQGGTYKPKVQTNGGKQGGSRTSKKVPIVGGGAACKGGWSGVIKFSRTLNDEGKKNRETARSVSKQEWSHDIDYTGTMIVDGSDPQKTATSSEVSFTEVRRQLQIENEISQCGAWKPEHWFTWEQRQNDIETGKGKGAAQSFFLYVDEARGTYKLSFTFPEVPGEYKREDRTTRSGHCQEKNNEPIKNDFNKVTVVPGGGGSVENQKINPSQPDVLEGTATIDNNNYSNPNNIKTPIIKISWKLQRCPPPLMITDVKFYHLNFPSPNTWEEVENSRNHYTIDGNDVKIVATIVNLSGAKKSATVNFKDVTGNKDLPEGSVPATFAPHEEKQVEYIWDTSGYAWKEAAPENHPVVTRQIEVRVPSDQKTEPILIYPKPIVLIRGLWSPPEKFARLAGYFKNQNVPWATVLAPVDVNLKASDNAPIIDRTVREMQERVNAWHVDLVAHSTGGLTARAYVNDLMPTQYDNRPPAMHLVMLGTPNLGTPCASGVDNFITKIASDNPESLVEISEKNMERFNQTVTQHNGTWFKAIVSDAISPTCKSAEPGDGIVPVLSAGYTTKSSFYTKSAHEELITDQKVFAQIRKWLALPPSANFAPDRGQK